MDTPIFEKKNVLVTGGAGFIGSHLCERLLKEAKVICLDDFSNSTQDNIGHLLQYPDFEFVKHDINEPIDLEKLDELKKFKVEFQGIQEIYHLACPTSPKDFERLKMKTLKSNSAGMLNTLDIAVKYKAKYVFGSSSVVYGDSTPENDTFSEHEEGLVNHFSPRACYDEGKRFAETCVETYCQVYGVDAKIARVFTTYGPKMKLFEGQLIPDFIINRYSIMGRVDALINLHLPQDIDITEKARYRLAFEDIFMIQIAIGMKRVKRRFLEQGVSHNFTPDTMLDFKNALPFGLTEAQERVLRNIEKDMRAPSPMNRLLQGEVGTGKTVVAAYASLLSASGNYQTAIMVPTEILAQQQYVKISEFLSPFNIETGLLIGGLEKDCRREIVGDIASGEISVVVGTHALLQEDVEFNNLGLIVVDEQHKFGVQQRRILKKKGSAPDYLIMTATPIPRTLALTIFGDMDISTIRETPFGEKKISTYWVGTKRRRYVYSFLKELVDSGAQGFMVCPRIEESEDELRNVQEAYRDLESLLGPDRVALLHGKMSGEDKKKIIDEFKKGEISVLVSTIVIEVGIDVPDASIIIIEDADRFGLSQLHQLRGRVGRASQNAYCILLADPKTGEAYKRLNAIVSIEDGFRISEEDLKIRGSGEILGIRQHGFISTESLQLAYQNADLLESIRGEAFELLERDPFLKDLANRALAEELKSRFRFL